MPIETALPGASVEWIERDVGPVREQFVNNGFGQNAGATLRQTIAPRIQVGGTTTIEGSEVFGTGSSGVDQYFRHRGVYCVRATNNNNDDGAAYYRPLSYGPVWDPGAVNPGYRGRAASLVFVQDIGVALESLSALGNTPDTSGIFFAPATANNSTGAVNMAAMRLGSANARGGQGGGFGCYLTEAVGPVSWVYVSWDGTTELERVPIPSSVIPDVTAWSNFRYVIVAARPGQNATMRLEVNGTTIVEREFDDVLLMRPQSVTGFGSSLGYRWGVIRSDFALTQGYFLTWQTRVGRITPQGTVIQSP